MSYLENTLRDIGPLLLQVLGALGILLVGFVLAKIFSSAIGKLMDRTTIDDRIATAFAGEGERPIRITPILQRIVFWLVMLLALVAAFQVLDLSFVTSPFNSFLGEVADYIPNLIAAGVLIVVAYLVAGLLRFGTRAALQRTGMDERLSAELHDQELASRRQPPLPDGPETEAPMKVSEALSTAVYYIVWLLFLPAILGALQLTGLLEPVESMVNEALHFLPNLLAAVLIGVVGVFVARFIRRIVVSLSAAAGVDRLGDRVGVSKVLGDQRLSQTLGTVAYVLVLIPVIIAALNALDIQAVTEPASEMLHVMLAAVPKLFAAAVVLIIAWILGQLVAGLVASLLASVGFNTMLAKMGLTTTATGGVDQRAPSDIVGTLVLVFVMLFASIEAASLLGFEDLANIITGIMWLAGQILLGLVIFALGLWLADFSRRQIRESDLSNATLVSRLTWWGVVILSAFMALDQMGLAADIINLAFGLTLGAAAVAAAIAFGWGGRELAKRKLEKWVDGGKMPPPPPESAKGIANDHNKI